MVGKYISTTSLESILEMSVNMATHISSDTTIPLPGLCPVDILTQVSNKVVVTLFVITKEWKQSKHILIRVWLNKYNRVPCSKNQKSLSILVSETLFPKSLNLSDRESFFPSFIEI